MIEIAQNFSLFKKGIFDTFKMFKMMYQNDHNILFLKNNTLYINNVEQLVNERSKATDAYSFGVDFALQNLKNFRENICINIALQFLQYNSIFSFILILVLLHNFASTFAKDLSAVTEGLKNIVSKNYQIRLSGIMKNQV